MAVFAKDVNISFQIRLADTDDTDVTGKAVGDLTVRLANANSTDWEWQTATTHFTLDEMSLGAYKLTLLAARNDTYGELAFQIECSGCVTERYTHSISDKQGDPVALGGVTSLAKMIQQDYFTDGMIWVDDGGTASTSWPYGTAPYPVNTIARSKTVADDNSISRIHIHGNLSLAAAMEHYNFFGDGHVDLGDLFDINGQSIEHSSIHNIIVTGATGNGANVGDQTRYLDCLLYIHTNIHGVLTGGALGGACSIRDGGYALFTDSFFGEIVACTLTLQAPSQCDIMNMRGAITLAGMDGGVCSISTQKGASVTINNTCTAGTIDIMTDGTVTDNSGAGCTVNITLPVANTTEVEGGDATDAINAACDAAISDATLATSTALATVDTEVGQIKAVTDVLPDNGALTSLAQATALATVETEVGEIKGATAGKKVINAAGTQVLVYDADDALLVTLDRTGTGPYTWTPTWE